MSIHTEAHAKLNLALGLRGIRPDGYHLIDTIFQETTLCDYIEISPSDTLTIECSEELPEVNTIRTAVFAFSQAADVICGARIRIEKNIPMGAGLGGGSSDAAAVLLALNQLYGQPLTHEAMMKAAQAVGADTPFFISGGTQQAAGIGELLRPVRNRCEFTYLLIKPEKGVDTAQAYSLSDTLTWPRVHVERAAKALEEGDRDAFFDNTGNALMPAAEILVPDIAEIGRECMDLGARFWMMTGSGSCVFSIFDDESALEHAYQRMSARYPFAERAGDYNRESDHARAEHSA